MPESGSYGSVRGALSNERPYRDLVWNWARLGRQSRAPGRQLIEVKRPAKKAKCEIVGRRSFDGRSA